jgi:hypothetical protein
MGLGVLLLLLLLLLLHCYKWLLQQVRRQFFIVFFGTGDQATNLTFR